MTDRDKIIRMAREAHGPITGQWWDMDAAALERFYRAAFAAGAAAERERIVAANAPVIESINRHIKTLEEAFDAAIRARNKG